MEKNNQLKQVIYNVNYAPYFLFLAGFIPLSLALISQHFFGMQPCPLCIYQRYPFIVVIFFSVLALFIKNRKLRLSVVFISILAFLINTGISFYHFGVEQDWWDFGDCTANLDASSIEALRASIFNAPNVRCDEVQFELFGLSMAGWNIFYSFFSAIFFLHYFNLKYLRL